MRCGFIGLGNIGKHLAGSLVRGGLEVTVHDLVRATADPLVEAGARWAGSVGETCDASDTVFTCLPSSRAIDMVVAGPGGVLESLAGRSIPGVWVEMSTNDRSETLRLGALAAERGIAVLEAPVTGGVHKAAAGEITVLVGGDRSVFDRHAHVLRTMGDPVLHIGELGSAAVLKVITNMLAFINLVGVGEALMLAKRADLDLGTVFEAIRHSSGNSFVHETESQVILNGSYNINFTMDLALKDLGFALGLGRELGVPLDLAGLTNETFVQAKEAYGGGAWSSQVVKLLEDALSTDLRAPGFPAELG